MKSEARNPKSETNPNDLNTNVPNDKDTGNKVAMRGLEHSNFEFVSDFDIRISKFPPVETDKLFLNTD